MLIDAHLHVFVRPSAKYPRETDALTPATREAPVEQLLDLMDANGVDKAGLVQLGGTGLAKHAYLRDCLRRFPGRFAGIGLVDADADDPARELDEPVEAVGVKGIRLNYLGDPDEADVTRQPTYPLWQRLAERALILWLYPSDDQIPLIEPFIQAFPSIPVVMNHLGMCPDNFSIDKLARPHIDAEIPPPTLPTILRLARCSNVYVKLSGQYGFSHEPYPYRDLRPLVQSLYDAFGADRLLWATDFPWIVEEPGYDRLVRLLEEQLPSLSAQERARIMGGTAAALFGFQ